MTEKKVRVSTHDYDTKNIDVSLKGNILHIDIGQDKNQVDLSSLIPIQKDFKVTSGSFEPISKSIKLIVSNNTEEDEVIIPLQGLLDIIPTIQGQRGTNGTNGRDGKSAYELAVQNGYIGTVTDWLASLKGLKGDKGNKGDKGDTGDSAYESWKKLGNQGTQQDFINSLRGGDGKDGRNGRDGIDATDVFMTEGSRFDLTTLTAYGSANSLRIEDEFLQKEETASNHVAVKVNKGIDTHSISIIELYDAGWQILNTKETGLFELFKTNGLDMKKFDTATIKLFNPKVSEVDTGGSGYPVFIELYLYSVNGRRSGRTEETIKLTRQYRNNPLVNRGNRVLTNKASFTEDRWTEWSLETNVDGAAIPTVATNYTAGKGIVLNGNSIEANLGNNLYFTQDNKIASDSDALEIRASTRMIRSFSTISDSEMQANDNLYKIFTRLKIIFDYPKPVISHKNGNQVSAKVNVNNVKIRLRPDPSNELVIRKIENAHPTHHEVTWTQEGNDWVFTVGTLYKNEAVFADLIVHVDGAPLMKANGAVEGTTKNVNYLLDIEHDATNVTTVTYESGLRAELTRNS